MSDVMSRLSQLRNSLGEQVDVVTDEAGTPRAAAPNGRLVVAPGQTIASAWGNTTYDQTMQTFASAADRTNQWPAPNEGSLSFLTDTKTPWIFRNGAWHGLPIGILAFATGPASQTDCGSGGAVVVSSPSFPICAGRRYRAICYVNASQQTATGLASVSMGVTSGAIAGDMSGAWVAYVPSLAVGGVIIAGVSLTLTASGTGNAVLNLRGTASAGVLRFGANGSSIAIEDIGG